MSFIYCCLGKINQPELSILLVTLLVVSQPIRTKFILIDEIDVDSYLFHSFLDVFIVKN